VSPQDSLPRENDFSDTLFKTPPLPNEKPAVATEPIATISDTEQRAPIQELNSQPTLPAPVEQALIVAPVIVEQDPYFRPDPVQPLVPQPIQPALPAPTGAPVQFIVRSASPIRSLPQLDRESICTVARTPQQPTITRFFKSRQMSHNNRRFPNLRRAIGALERSRCSAIAVPPRLIGDVISTVRDPSRYVVLPEIVK